MSEDEQETSEKTEKSDDVVVVIDDEENSSDEKSTASVEPLGATELSTENSADVGKPPEENKIISPLSEKEAQWARKKCDIVLIDDGDSDDEDDSPMVESMGVESKNIDAEVVVIDDND